MQRNGDDGAESIDEAAWKAIVDNYGEQPLVEDLEPAYDEPAPEPEAEMWRPAADDDAFVPPEPPPIPRPTGLRLAAWIGVFGVPLAMIVAVVAGIRVDGWIGLLLAAGFVGGFLYLVLQTPPSPRDPWDDGARV